MIDLLDFVILGFFVGKNLIVVWNKMFFNFDNVLQLKKIGWFWNQIMDFDSIEFDVNVYRRLI